MHRTVGSIQKPENVLKRVNELIKSGNNSDKVKVLALEQLHNMFTQKKRAFQKIYETIMKRHLELCVDLKDFRTAKDGLHQYRTMTQLVDPQSLESVAMHLIEMAEHRASEARMKADKVALAAAAKISDLDQEETPETIMLTSMTYDGAKDRTNREVVVPWLKFLWETYRTVLELLYKNTRLEKVYHKTCEKAFKFCLDYQRTNEFRRLCEMLRSHFGSLQRATQQMKTNKTGWEWTSEGVELHLQTRFSQLEVATSLELWNEGFRTVEDIYDIMQINKKTPKPKLMVTYYEKLTRIFWVSENYLFHAYAWYRYYILCVESKKDMKPEERVQLASCALLAAICIPNFRETEGPAAVLDEDEVASGKNAQMALLLDFQANPTRQALLGEIVAKGVLNEVSPELSALYASLEGGFNPLGLVKDVTPLLAHVKSDPQMAIYALPLQRVAVVRTVMQLSRVFSTLRMSYLKDLLSGLDLSYCEVEKLLVDSAANKQLQLRIDHGAACIRFGTAVATTAAIETQVAVLGSQLNRVAETIASTLNASRAQEEAADRREYLARIADSLEEEYAAHVERRNYIERRKEGLERAQQEKQREEDARRADEEARRREEESQRLRKEEEARKIAKEKKIKDQIDVAKTKKALEAHGKIVDESVLNDLDETSRRALLREAQSDAQKAKEEEVRRLMEQQKRLDYVTRALRIEASEIIAKKYEEDVEADRRDFEARLGELRLKEKEEHSAALLEKARLARAQPLRAAFESSIIAQQRALFDKKVAKEYEKAVNEHRQRKVARARQLREDELERQEEELELEREQREREEEARRQEEQAEERRRLKAQQEEDKRTRDADLERKRQEQLATVARQKKEVEEAEQRGRAAAAAEDDSRWGRRPEAAVPPERTRAEPVGGSSSKEPSEWRGSGRAPPVAVAAAGGSGGGGEALWRGSRGDAPPSRGGGFGSEARGEGAPPARGGFGGDRDARATEAGGWSRSAAPPARTEEPKMSSLERLAALGTSGRDEPRKWGGGGGGGRTDSARGGDASKGADEGRWRR